MKEILIIKGDDTSFDNDSLMTIKINSEESLEGFSASLTINTATLMFEDVSSGLIDVNLSSSQTQNLQSGKCLGRFVLYDTENRPKLTCNIPFVISENLPAWKPINPDIEINYVEVTLIRNSRDYEDLKNLPMINEVELIGNKTASDLGLATPTDIESHNVSDTSHQDIRDLINRQGEVIEDLSTRVTALEETLNEVKLILNI